MTDAWAALWLSLRVALVALVFVVPVGTVAAWRLTRMHRSWAQKALEAILLLPLVLPPTVVGFGLLLLLGHGTPFGRWLNDSLGLHLLFTWPAAALAAAVMAFPLYARTVVAAFRAVDPELLDAARALGADEMTALWRVMIPTCRNGIAAGASLALARAVGEFGATIMVAGSIPGLTRTLPLELYQAVQSGDDAYAARLAGMLILIAVALLAGIGALEKK